MMGFKGKQFIKVAEEIEKNYKGEPYLRTAVGRYYYACFLTGRSYYEHKTHKRLGKKDAHERLINYFQGSRNPIEKKLGNKLKNMRNYRNNADYAHIFKKENIKRIKKESRQFFKYIRKL